MKTRSRKLFLALMIPLMVVLVFYMIFTALQNETIYRNSLGKITQTYLRMDDHWDIANVDMPYKKIDEMNLVNWDAVAYHYQKDHLPNEESEFTMKHSFGFFPVFPWVWKITGIPVKYIGIFNFLLFSFSLLVVMHLLLKDSRFSNFEKCCIYITCLSFPSVGIYFLPYSEAVFTATFFIGIWGLIKKNYWVYFIFMLLSAMTRASVVIVIASIVATDLFFFLRERNFKQFMKEMSLKVAPFVLGMLAVFFYHYLYSGNFFKYYEVQSTFWTNNLQWPTKLADWSIEGYGMNIAAIFLVTLPGLIYFFSWRVIKPKSIGSGYPSVFGGNLTEIKRYFWLNSIVYFAGFLLYILMFRGGSLHCFHRFIISSPYFFLFILILFERMPELPLRQRLLLFIPGMVIGLIFVILLLYPGLHFKDSGFILFSLLLLYVLLFDKLRPIPKLSIALILALYAILWYTFLYNNYISCAWIFA